MSNKISKKKENSLVVKAAMKMTSNSVNSACLLFSHQPKLPEAAKKLRKF